MMARSILALLLIAAAVAPAQAAGASPVGRWRAVEISGAPVAAGVETTLELEAGGKVSGNGGCNRFGGTATLGDGSIGFGPTMATRMACPEPAMAQEQRFFEMLEKAARWRLEGGGLVLLDRAGGALARFTRAPRAGGGG